MGKFSKYLDGTKKVTKKVIKNMDPVELAATTGKAMVKKTDPGIQNLWTGYRESKTAIVAGGLAASGYIGYSTFKQTEMAPKPGVVSYSGTAPNQIVDGGATQGQAPTLGANGNMVFGLHQARKG